MDQPKPGLLALPLFHWSNVTKPVTKSSHFSSRSYSEKNLLESRRKARSMATEELKCTRSRVRTSNRPMHITLQYSWISLFRYCKRHIHTCNILEERHLRDFEG
ncbi:hypothetical protein V6N13_128834 [Hibiscus sabdariffa]